MRLEVLLSEFVLQYVRMVSMSSMMCLVYFKRVSRLCVYFPRIVGDVWRYSHCVCGIVGVFVQFVLALFCVFVSNHVRIC